MMTEKSTKILVVDDVDRNRALMAAMLTPQGYQIIEASNGKEAVEMARSHKPDFIFMDIFMPTMDGFNACSAIKADDTTKSIPVVIVTAIGHEVNKEYAKSMGADGFISKPFTTQDLLNAINELMPAP